MDTEKRRTPLNIALLFGLIAAGLSVFNFDYHYTHTPARSTSC